MITISKTKMNALKMTINIAACVLFVVSLFMPMEGYFMSGVSKSSWTVLENSVIFVLASFAVPSFAFWSLPGGDLYLARIFVIYKFIGIGEVLVFLTPLLDYLIPILGRKKGAIASLISFLISVTAFVALLSYGADPNLQLGGHGLMSGYYLLTLSFLLILISASIRLVISLLSSSS